MAEKSLKNYKVMAVLHLPEAREDFAYFGFSHNSVLLRKLNELLG
jgi:hypothetical protein